MRSLLLIDPDGMVVLADVDTGARYRFDDLPTEERPGNPAPARTAVWSASGEWTAWSTGDVEPAESHAPHRSHESEPLPEVRLHHEGASANVVLVAAQRSVYLGPSPSGRYLSHLSPGPLGPELAVSDVHSGRLHVVERGRPMFWSWSPDSSWLAIHVENRVVLASPTGAEEAVLLTEDAAKDAFMVPWWTSDGRVLYGRAGGIHAALPDGTSEALANLGPGRFIPDPDGRRLAMFDEIDNGAALVILDLLTAERTVVSREQVMAFAWSPEGRRLAALVAVDPAQVQWIVHDGDTLVRLTPFRPSPKWQREVVPFFEQYTQSHTVWSADGRQLVAPGIDAQGSGEALVQTVDAVVPTEYVPGACLAWWANP